MQRARTDASSSSQMDPYQTQYGFTPANGGQQHTTPSQFIPAPPAPYSQQPASVDGINAFFSSAPTQFIGQQFVQGSQQYVQRFQEKIGDLSGSILNYHFAVSTVYVRKKLLILLAPYLRKWDFSRLPEQIPGGPKFRAPRADVNCPDLYIPLMAYCSYCVFGCLKEFVNDQFTTDDMFSNVYRGMLGWFVHICVFKFLAYMMSMYSASSFVESACYTGYMFVLLTVQLLGGIVKVRYSSLLLWLYTSTCMAVFLVRSMKRLLHHQARHYGGDVNKYNYVLLSLACFQFLLFYFMG